MQRPICRPQTQYDAVMKWHETHPFKHWCSDPFEVRFEGEFYTCAFIHTYINPQGKACAIRVTPTGRITKAIL